MKAEISTFLLRLESSLFESLKTRAADVGVSMNEFCKNLLGKDSPSANQKFDGLGKFLKTKMKVELIGVVLFGSTARGTATANSDTDLLIILESDDIISRDLYDCWDDYIAENNELDLKQYSPHFCPLPTVALRTEGIWLETSLDGIVLWEQNFRVSRFLGTIRKAIAEHKLVRKISHGHPYWILAEENA
jgi:hypothetical protein